MWKKFLRKRTNGHLLIGYVISLLVIFGTTVLMSKGAYVIIGFIGFLMGFFMFITFYCEVARRDTEAHKEIERAEKERLRESLKEELREEIRKEQENK